MLPFFVLDLAGSDVTSTGKEKLLTAETKRPKFIHSFQKFSVTRACHSTGSDVQQPLQLQVSVATPSLCSVFMHNACLSHKCSYSTDAKTQEFRLEYS